MLGTTIDLVVAKNEWLRQRESTPTRIVFGRFFRESQYLLRGGFGGGMHGVLRDFVDAAWRRLLLGWQDRWGF